MNRSARIGRSNRRALAVGVAASVLVHAAAFALLRFEVELPAEPAAAIALLPSLEPVPEPAAEPIEVVEIVAVAAGEPISNGGGTPASSAAAAPVNASPTAIPVSSEPLLAARPAEERAFDPIVFADPVLEPAANVDFSQLAVADVAPVEPADEYPLYEPGGVGQAKKKWANTGSGAGLDGDKPGFGFGIGMGGGHCPMPGRGGIGPYWIGIGR